MQKTCNVGMMNMEVLPFKQEELLGKAAKSMSVHQDKQIVHQYSSTLRGVITMKKRRLKSYFELLPEANPLVKREFGYIENIRNVFTRPLSALPTLSVLGLDELTVKGVNGYDQEDLEILQKTNSTEQNGSYYRGQMQEKEKEKIPYLSSCRALHNGQPPNDNIINLGVNRLEDIIGSNYHFTQQQGYYSSNSPVVTPRCEYPHNNSNNSSNTMEFRSLWEGIGGENGIIYSREGEWSNSYKCSLFRITELRRADTPTQGQIIPDGVSSRKRLDEIIERNLQQEGVLRFESRFESGNLALAGRPKREQNGTIAAGIVSPEESMGSSIVPVAQTAATTTAVLSTSSISLVPSSITTPRRQFLSQPPANPQNTYNLVLQNDINTNGYTQWFCFSVFNGSKGLTATFNILNFYKGGSLFGKGMKISIYSSISGQQTGWIKGGEDIQYTRNNIIKSNDNYYYTLSFKHTFQHDNDTVTFAYNIPYTYTELQKYLLKCETDLAQVNILNRKLLCRSVAGNRIDLLSITNPTSDLTTLNQRQGIVITARVHPGETVSSHIMHGVIQFLLDKTSKEAHQLRDRFVFKVLPMLNPDGVIHGNYRCSLTGCDLNRRWKNPNPTLHPEVYYTKKMIMEFHEKHPISMIIDLHGHSRKKDVFAYGCHDKTSPFACREFPFIFSKIDRRFSFKECNFKIQRSREGTARIAMYRELNISNIFTMESSFCGASYDEANLFSVDDFQQIGQSLCQAIGIKFQVFNNNDDKDNSTQDKQKIKNGNRTGNPLKITDSSKVFLDELYANEDMINIGLRNDSESDSQPSEDNLSDAELKSILRSSKKVKPKLITQTIGIKQQSSQQQQQQSLQPYSASLTQSPSPPQSAGITANTKKRFMNVTAKIQTIFPPAPATDAKSRIRVNVFAKPQPARQRIAASNPPPVEKSPSPQRSEIPSKIMVAIEPKFMHFPLRGNNGSDAFQTTQDGLFQRRLPEYSQSRKLRDIQARQAGGSGSTSHRMSLQQRIRQGGLSEGSKQVIHLSLQESIQQQQSSYNERQQYNNNITALVSPGIAVAMGSTSWTNPSQSWVNITQNNKSNTIGGTTWSNSLTQSPGSIESPLFSNSVLHGNLQASLDYSSNPIVPSDHHSATKYIDASESLMNLLKSRGGSGNGVTTDKPHMNIFGKNSLIRNSLLKQQTNNFVEEQQQSQIYQLPSERNDNSMKRTSNDCNTTSPLSRSIYNHSGSFYQSQQSSPIKQQLQQSQYVSLLNTSKRMNESIDLVDNTNNNVNSNTISSIQSNQGIFLPRHYSYVVKPSTAPRSLGIRLRKNQEQSSGDNNNNSILQREDGMIVSHRKTISDDFSSNHGSSNNNSSSRGYGVSSSFRRIT